MIKIFFTKEIISRNKSFIYEKIGLDSDLVFIKTLKFILVQNHIIVSEGIGANNLPLFDDDKSVFKKSFLLPEKN